MSLDPNFILDGYRRGCFPMAESRVGTVRWFEADPRGVIPLDIPRVPRRLRRYMKQFTFTVDTAFERVIDGCARPRTWISLEIRAAYLELHRLGHVHSVEAWQDGELAGGLYGVHIGAAFMAESMFHLRDNAGGACVVTLIDRLRERGFRLLDIQEVTKTTARYGGIWISKVEYLERLAAALAAPPAAF